VLNDQLAGPVERLRPGGSDGSTDLGVIGVELSPLVTSTASASNPDGVFCSGQTMSNNNRL
jgi:hypothetical protein